MCFCSLANQLGQHRGPREATSLSARSCGGWQCSSQQLCWLRVLWGTARAWAVSPGPGMGELAGFLSAVAALPAPGVLERDFSSSSTFFPRGFHEDSCVCPCSSAKPPVSATCCKTCCSQVSLSHVQQWPGRGGAGGRAEGAVLKSLSECQCSSRAGLVL